MSTTNQEQVNVLLVIDSEEDLAALVSVLDRPDYRLITASSGSGALKLVLKERIAIMLLDVGMPAMDGIEVAALIKARERSRHIPIIFLTRPGVDDERVGQAYALGAVDCLAKPVVPEIVRAKVAVFVDLYRMTEELKREAELLREHDCRERDRRIEAVRAAGDLSYRQLAETLPQIVFRAGADGAVSYLSPRWRERTGIADAAAAGWGWLRAVHAEDVERVRTQWTSSLRTETGFELECRLRHAVDRSFRWYLYQALPVRDPGTAVIGWVGTYTDITPQRAGARAARARRSGSMPPESSSP